MWSCTPFGIPTYSNLHNRTPYNTTLIKVVRQWQCHALCKHACNYFIAPFAHGCTCASTNIYLFLSSYKNLIRWVSKLQNDGKGCLPANWEHAFPSFEAFKIAWRELGSKQILVPSDYNGKVGVGWDVDEFLKYISTQDGILDAMTSPLLDGERPYVLIIRGGGFPCGSRPWVQLAIGVANHGQKAGTLVHNWTIDVALTSQHNIDALRETFTKTLEAI